MNSFEQLTRRNAELEQDVARLRMMLAANSSATAGQAGMQAPNDDHRLAVLVGLLTTCIWSTDADGVFVEPQPSWQAYTGQSWEECRGEGWASALHPDDRDRLRDAWQAAVRMRSPYNAEGRIWRAGPGEYRHFVEKAAPVLGPDGEVREWVGMHTDVHDRKQAEEARALSERRLSAVLNNTRMAVFMMDDRQHCVYMNAAAEHLTGYRLEETQGRPLHDVIHHTYPDGRLFPLHECAIDRAFPEDNQMEGEEVFVHKDGHFYPVAYTASPIRDEQANAVGTIIEARDIRAEKEHQRRIQLLINELNHRVKNTLATVQSIVRQGLVSQNISPELKAPIEARLVALSRSHDLLNREAWSSAGLKDLVQEALAPFGLGREGAERIRTDGRNVRLAPNAALALSMALHELATNAVKYGALSNDRGTIHLTWCCEGERLHLIWKEQGGPPVVPPSRRGFGSRLIGRGLARELDGVVELSFAPEGVVCTIEMPVRGGGGGPTSLELRTLGDRLVVDG